MSHRQPSANLPTSTRPFVLTLWGHGFNEVMAAKFMRELRRLGLRVLTVGLNMQQTKGIYGLTLLPDCTLDQALALVPQSQCVIIPGTTGQLQQFSYDPRLAELLHQATANQAVIVLGQDHAPKPNARHAIRQSLLSALLYTEQINIRAFIRSTLMPRLDPLITE